VTYFDSTGGLRGFKRSYYEGGVRSPSIIRWPGVTAAGAVSGVPWAFWDVLPTLLEMAGVTAPADAHLDGRSIVPALHGKYMDINKLLYWTWRGAVADDEESHLDRSEPADAGTSASPPGYAARVGEWKVVVHACADQSRMRPSMGDVMEVSPPTYILVYTRARAHEQTHMHERAQRNARACTDAPPAHRPHRPHRHVPSARSCGSSTT
jgi:arylsulfatase A-like enzyme